MTSSRPRSSLALAVGARLRAARQGRGVTQYELARAMNVTQGAVSNYEHGLRDIPVVALLRALNYIDCPPGEFFLGIEEFIVVLGSARDLAAAERDRDRASD